MTNATTMNKKSMAILLFLGYTIMVSYAFARPPTDSLFLELYGATSLPKAWFFTSIWTIVIVALYNWFARKNPLMFLLGRICLISLALLCIFLPATQNNWPFAGYFLYAWKEIYCVLLVEIFWSFSDMIFCVKKAKNLYGIFLAVGSVGSLTGNLMVSQLSTWVGTTNCIWVAAPLLGLCFFMAQWLVKSAGDPKPLPKENQSYSVFDGMKVLYQSKYLVPLTILLGVTQIVIPLIDFQFNHSLQLNYPELDQRTSVTSLSFALLNTLAIVLPLMGPLLFRFVGVSSILLAIPFINAASTSLLIASPTFLFILISKVSAKSMDYTIFRAAKEILYIPLTRDEKTQGKAIIDVLMYRVGKGASSLLIMGIVGLGASTLIPQITLFFLVIWISLTLIILQRFKRSQTEVEPTTHQILAD